MSFEAFVAMRYLLAKRKQAFISVISLISVLGVGLGVASLIVVIGVMTGFSQNLREKILGVNAHIIVTSFKGPFSGYQDLATKAAKVPGVIGVTPFVYSEVIASSPNGVKGLVLRGIDPVTAGGVLHLTRDLVQGRLEDLTQSQGTPGIIVGQDLAERLGLNIGDQVSVLAPSGRRTSAGFTPEIRFFTIIGVFKSGMFEVDSSMAFASIPATQDLLGFQDDLVTGLEVRLADVESAKIKAEEVNAALGGFPFFARDWMQMNESLFSALKLEKTAMFVILVMIVLVGSFSIVTTLVMLVMEKTRDISILMAMGAKPENIRNIFMLQGSIIGLVGTCLGFLLGVGISLFLEKYQPIKLPADVYYMDHIPIQLEWLDLTIIGVAALALCFLATLYPARQASRLNPSEALRYE